VSVVLGYRRRVYQPAAFAVDDVEIVVSLARASGLGHLVVIGEGRPLSTPMPFVISDDGLQVRGHLARPNRVWRAAPCRALLIVPVSDTYISPSWYPSKAEHGKVVPTWNYEVVHAHGDLIAHDDRAWVADQIEALTNTNEAVFEQPWSVADAPADYVAQMQAGIVGVELLVDRLDGKRKLSQNRPEADVTGVIAGLAASGRRGAGEIAEAMRAPTPGAS
jgi:transcriptional regulator